jgi:NAD(P)H dehydrogenase (quinone)
VRETQDVPEATLDDLDWADAVLFGTPTRSGLPSAQLKQFIDTAGPLWAQRKLVNKVGSSFTSTATAHGGQETTIVSLTTTLLPGDVELASVEFQSRRAVEIAAAIKRGFAAA